ncbi:MAG: protein kinase [Planctomycetota bacterium]
MDTQENSSGDAKLSWFTDGVTILDALGDDAAGKRALVQRADGSTAHLIEPPEEAQSSLAFRERFKAKAAAATTAEHSNIVPTLGFAEERGRLFLAEADVKGVTLADLTAPEGMLDADAVLEVGAHAAAALDALHRHQLVHGWIRPDAIVVTGEKALLRECGLEHPKGETISQPEFMSPEQLSEDHSLRPASDFFSLGSTLFAAIVGRPPFAGDTPEQIADAIRHGRVTYPSLDEPRLAKNLRLLFAKLFAADPDQRPRSADELLADIEAVRRGERIRRVTEVPPPPPRRKHKRKMSARQAAAIGGAAALCVFAAVVLVVALPERQTSVEKPADKEPSVAVVPTTGPAAAVTRPAKVDTPAKPEPPAPARLAAKLCAAADAYAKAHPTEFDEIIRRFEEVAARYPGTPAALNAARKATDFALKKSGKQLSEFAAVQTEADRLMKDRRFGAAIDAFKRHAKLRSEIDGFLARGLRDKIERQISFVEAKAAEAYARESEEAAKAVKARRYKDAVAVYERVVALYGIEEHTRRAREELAIVRPLLAASGKVAEAEAAKAREKMYRETAALVRERVKAFDLDKAVAQSEGLVKRLEGSDLEPNAALHLAHLRRLLALKRRVIEKINSAPQKLKSESLGIRAPASVITAADVAGITLQSKAGTEKRPWPKLSDWEKYSIVRSVSNLDSRDDLSALGLLSLEQGNRARAAADLDRAQRLGADVAGLLARAKQADVPDVKLGDDRPARMLVEARALAAEKKWLDALALLIPLKEKHAAENYAIRARLDEINALLDECSRGLARADIERDVAAGVETELLADGIGGWAKRGEGWALVGRRVTCDNRADHDIELLKPAEPAPAYRLSVRCRVLSGNGLLIRVASDGDSHYDLWLELGDKAKCGLWDSSGGRMRTNNPLPVALKKGEWIVVRAIVTGRYVRAECRGRSALLTHRLKTGAGAERSYGFITRQKSAAEFEDFRLRILREQ